MGSGPHIALLRAVNVGGSKPLAMQELRRFLVEVGFADAKTLLQSGNVVFRAAGRTPGQIESLLEIEAERRLSLATDFFVRTASEWEGVLAGNPFPREAEGAPSHLLVMFLKRAPSEAEVVSLREAIRGPEEVRIIGREAYLIYPEGIGRSKLTGALIERKLHARGTARNWNTILKLGAMAGA